MFYKCLSFSEKVQSKSSPSFNTYIGCILLDNNNPISEIFFRFGFCQVFARFFYDAMNSLLCMMKEGLNCTSEVSSGKLVRGLFRCFLYILSKLILLHFSSVKINGLLIQLSFSIEDNEIFNLI